jgi:hypothetical protein
MSSSDLSAAMGSSREARIAGWTPNTTPMPAETWLHRIVEGGRNCGLIQGADPPILWASVVRVGRTIGAELARRSGRLPLVTAPAPTE